MKLLTKPRGYLAVFVLGGRWRQVDVVGWLQRDADSLPEAVCNADPLCISKSGQWVLARDIVGFQGVYRSNSSEGYGAEIERYWRRCFPDAPVTWSAVEWAPFVPSGEAM